MKTFVLGLLAASQVIVTGCAAADGYFGSGASGARASNARTNASAARTQCETEAPTVTLPLYTGGTIPDQAPTGPAGALAVVVSHPPYDRTTYAIQLVDTSGQSVAGIKAHTRSPITQTCDNLAATLPAPPVVSASNDRLYYIDGDTDIRYLAPDGSTGLAARVPGSSQSLSVFAVSPDDSSLAVAVLDLRWRPVLDQIYVQDLNTQSRVELTDSNKPFRWPVGWHDGKILVAEGGTGRLELLDPGTGRTTATIDGKTCEPIPSLPTSAGFACTTPTLAIGRLDWSGNVTIFAAADAYTGGAALSPDGSQLLASGTGAAVKLVDSPETGSRLTSLGLLYGYPGEGGWLDAFHVVYRVAGTPSQVILDVRSQTVVSLPPAAVLAARLPGGY